MKVGITGARGRLAPVLADGFRGRGDEVILYSRTGGSAFVAIEDLDEGSAPDVLIHCAWSSLPLTAEGNPGLASRSDIPLLQKILRVTGQKGTLIVFPSTGAVYGNTGDEPAHEMCQPAPLGAYARGKLLAEDLLLSEAPQRSLILRAANLLGEATFPLRAQGVLPRMLEAAKSGTALTLWGDGTATKDYLHCSDFVAAVHVLLDHHHRGIFNIGSGTSLSLIELIREVEDVVGSPMSVQHVPHYEWDVSHSRLSVEKLQSTGWSPKVGIREAIERSLKSL